MKRQSFSFIRFGIEASAILFAMAACGIVAQAQTPPAKQVKKPVPSLSNDDFELRRTTPTAAAAAAADGSKTPADGSKGAEEKKASPEEIAWRESIAKSRSRVTELVRASESAELSAIDLKNSLSASNRLTAGDVNQTNSQIEAARAQVETLKSQLEAARSELEALVQKGKENNYEEAAAAKNVKDDGTPNEEYYTGRFRELTSQLNDAMREQRLYELKANELRQRLQSGKKGADEFYLGPIREELNDTLARLDQAREAASNAQEALDELKEQARRAGIEPGLFR